LGEKQGSDKSSGVGRYLVGVDLGGTNIRAAVCTLDGQILSDARLDSLAMEGPEATLGQIVKAVRKAVSDAGVDMSQVAGAGIGVPGHHDSKKGITYWSPNFKGWNGIQVLAPLRAELGVPVFMGNDANVAALGEFTFGAGREVNSMVMLTLGTGIGGGIVLDGKLWLGANEGAAEIGHTIILADGPKCSCGRRGCLESLARRDAIIDRAAQKLLRGRPSILWERANYVPWNVDPQMIAEAAQAGDEVALETMAETGYYVGIGVANCINMLNPEMVVIGGGIAAAGEPLWGPIERTVRGSALHRSLTACRVVPAALGDDAGVMGGAELARQEIMAG